MLLEAFPTRDYKNLMLEYTVLRFQPIYLFFSNRWLAGVGFMVIPHLQLRSQHTYAYYNTQQPIDSVSLHSQSLASPSFDV